MNAKEFKANAKLINKLIIWESGIDYTIAVFADFGAVGAFANCNLVSERTGKLRKYTSIDRALEFIRSAGYIGTIEIVRVKCN